MTAIPASAPRSPRVDQDAPLLCARGLRVSFPGICGPAPAVQGVSFTLFASQTLAIVGESGSGKSVTALSILGLLPAGARIEGGVIELHRKDGRAIDLLSAPPGELRSVRGGEIAMIFQEPMTSLNPVLTVGEQVIEAVRLHSRHPRSRAVELAQAALAEVGIDDPRHRMGQYPHEFSGGMRQRVMIAMALACGPAVLVADEPTTALDVTIQAQVLDLLDSIRERRGMGVLLITHDLGVVAERADVLCVMYGGRVVEYGRCDQVVSAPLHPYSRALLECAPSINRRRDRLVTIADVLGRVEPIRAGAAGGPELLPWWPRTLAPGSIDSAQAEPLLAEVAGGRWVLVNSVPGVDGASPPRVPYRRSHRAAGPVQS